MKTEKNPTDMLLLDGTGYLYFVARQPQATKMTRQEMREHSPSGAVQMDSMLGRTFTYRFLAAAAIVAVSALAAINMMLPPTW